MVEPVEIHFHGIEQSAAIEDKVRAKVAKLEKHFGRMTSCRVGIEAPQRTSNKPKVLQIKIEVGVPRRAPIVISHERKGSHASAELQLAIRDAFDVALRKLDDMAAKLGERAKIERSRRRPPREKAADSPG